MSSIVIKGDTSGQIEIAAPAVAGSNTLTLPASTGNIATTSDIADASNIVGANGTAGQVLQSDGDGTMSWADAGGGIWEQVESVTFSTTGFWNWRPDLYASRSDYKLFKIILDNIIPVADNVNFGYQWILNGSFNSAGASGVAWYATSVSGSPAVVSGGSGSGSGYYYSFYQVGSAANEYGICAEINCYNFDSDSSAVQMHGTGTFCDSSSRGNGVNFSMINRTSATVNGIRFVFSSNDIESGTARVLGLKV